MSTNNVSMSHPKVVELSAHDLPACCPNPHMEKWNSHPLVYINLENGEGKCSYCGAVYRLKAGEKAGHH